MKNKLKKLIVIDGNAIIHRSFHAIPPLTTKEGELVNAVYGFSSTIFSVISKFEPDYILATFDLAGPTFRHAEFADYKATRTKAPDELYAQIERVKEVVRAMGIPIYEKKGFEADDVIGTLVTQAEEKFGDKIENIIVTGDLDTLQLVSEKTKVYTMRRGLTDSVLYDTQKVFERYSLKPNQIIDFKGLRGDPSDNIPGVKGVGEKTASTLLQKYQTLENVFSNIEEITGSLKEKLIRDKMQALKSKSLATIAKNVPVELDLEKTKTQDFDRQKLIKLFQELNFFSLIKRIPQADNTTLSSTANNISEIKNFKYEIFDEKTKEAFLENIQNIQEIAIKLKTRGEKLEEKEFLGISLSWKNGRAIYIENNEKTFVHIKNILENKALKKIGYDLKNDIKLLSAFKINLTGDLFDVMLGAYVTNPGIKTDFSFLVLSALGEEIEEKNKKGQLGLEMETDKELADKICREVDYIFKLKTIYSEKISEISAQQKSKNNLEKIFSLVETPLLRVLADMEINGIKLNTIIFKGISEKITTRLKNLEKVIYELAGTEFNINSPKQLAEILFERLKIPTSNIKKGKTGFSTASAELQKIKEEYKIAGKIEEYREIFKLKTTYLDTLPLIIDKNSRIHTTFNQAVTATGRLSSSEPNLQNIPIRTDLGQLLRVAFEAREGYKLIGADYSQIDLRAVAHMSSDKKMIDLFWKNIDIHRATASEVKKIPLSQITEKMRSEAKALNFGVIYGMSTFGFSAAAGISREDAKKFIHDYMEKFSGIANFIKNTKEFAKKNLYVETELGRRRYVPEINSPNFQVQNSTERMAINMPIQGMSADIVKLAMIKVYEEYKNNPSVKMLLQVHDEIILEAKENIAQEVGKRVKEIMEQVYELKVPLVVDVKIGDNWGEI